MVQQTIIGSMVVHTVCHLRHHHHTEAFWNVVNRVLPQYRERQVWLGMNGASLGP